MNKEQIVLEIASQLATLKQELSKEIIKQIKLELSSITTKLNTKIDETCSKISTNNQAIQKNNQMVAQNSDLSTISENKLSKKIETKVMKMVERKYGAEIGRVLEWNSYQQQDTDEIVSTYQKAVMANDSNTGSQKLLTGRGNNKHIISEQVSLAFDYGDEDRY